MSKYTEAQFAAALLECGPHYWDSCDIDDCNSPSHPMAEVHYRERVYKYFIELFPAKYGAAAWGRPTYEWSQFWREYLKWVTS